MRNNEVLKYISKYIPMNIAVQKYFDLCAQKVKSLGLKILGDRRAKGALILVLGVLIVGALLYRNLTVAVQENSPTFTVKRGLFQLKITERGMLRAVRNFTISSGISSDRGRIIRLVPEGTYVKKGQVLVQFDEVPFKEAIERYKTEFERARAELTQAEEDLKAERARIDQTLKMGEDDIVLSDLTLRDLQEGSGPLRLQKAKFELEKYKAEHQKLERDYNEFKELVKEGYVSQVELDGIAQKRDQAKAGLEFAQAEYENLNKFTYPMELEKAKARMRAVKESYEKLKETAQYSIASKGAAISRAQANIANIQFKLNTEQDQLQHSAVYAPVEGFVIYSKIHLSGEERKVQIGDSVYPTHVLMHIPDTSSMLVDTQLREVDVHKVMSGQEATVRVDAYPDLILKGEVTLVGTLAEDRGKGEGGGKYFNLQIAIKNTDQRLRPGMTARVEILVDEEKDALQIPVEAVFERNGRKLAYVERQDKVEPREITTDKSNEDFVVIREGLSEGERVLLLDPTRELSTFEKRLEPQIPAAPVEVIESQGPGEKTEQEKERPDVH